MSRMNCTQPDHDNPKMVCGYPIPCPWHSVLIDVMQNPVTLTIPVTAVLTAKTINRISEVAVACSSDKKLERVGDKARKQAKKARKQAKKARK